MKSRDKTVGISYDYEDVPIDEIITDFKNLLIGHGFNSELVNNYFYDEGKEINLADVANACHDAGIKVNVDFEDKEADAYTVHDEADKLKSDLKNAEALAVEYATKVTERDTEIKIVKASKEAMKNKLEKLKTDYDVLNANTNKIISELKERLNEPCPNHCNACLKNTHGVVGDSGLRFITNTKFPENKG